MKSSDLRGVDYFRAGVVFMHGQKMDDLKTAQKFARLGVRRGYPRCLRIDALATDRLLVLQGKPQLFGTQFHRSGNGRWELFPYNLHTTDEHRKRYKVQSLQKLKNIVEYFNLKG